MPSEMSAASLSPAAVATPGRRNAIPDPAPARRPVDAADPSPRHPPPVQGQTPHCGEAQCGGSLPTRLGTSAHVGAAGGAPVPPRSCCAPRPIRTPRRSAAPAMLARALPLRRARAILRGRGTVLAAIWAVAAVACAAAAAPQRALAGRSNGAHVCIRNREVPPAQHTRDLSGGAWIVRGATRGNAELRSADRQSAALPPRAAPRVARVCAGGRPGRRRGGRSSLRATPQADGRLGCTHAGPYVPKP